MKRPLKESPSHTNSVYSSKADSRSSYGVKPIDRSKRKKSVTNKKRRQQQFKFITIAAVIVFFMFSIFAVTRKNAVNVYVGDNFIGMLKGTKITAEDFTKSVTAQLSGEVGTNVQINEEIKFVKTRLKKKDIVTAEYALSEIKRLVTYKVEAAVITVDGGEVAALFSKDEANRILKEIVDEYIPQGSNIVESGFVENVQVISKFVESNEIVTPEDGKSKLTAGTSAVQTYTVASGDTFSRIALKNGITIEDILAANPSLSIDTVLRVGDKLNLKVMVPLVSVKTAENVVFTEKQDKIIEYRKDNTKPVTYKKVLQQGKDGQKEVTTQIIRINGFETEQKVISENTTVEPSTEIIVVGTK